MNILRILFFRFRRTLDPNFPYLFRRKNRMDNYRSPVLHERHKMEETAVNMKY